MNNKLKVGTLNPMKKKPKRLLLKRHVYLHCKRI